MISLTGEAASHLFPNYKAQNLRCTEGLRNYIVTLRGNERLMSILWTCDDYYVYLWESQCFTSYQTWDKNKP